MRLVLAALLVLTLVGTATATDYLWFEVIGGAPANLSQGPMLDLEFDCDVAGGSFEIGMFISDEGTGLRGYGIELASDGTVGASLPVSDVGPYWDNHPVNFAAPAPATTILGMTCFTAGVAPIMGAGTMVATFTLDVGPGPEGLVGVGGGWTYSVNHYTGRPNWGGYFYESYIGDDYQAYGTLYNNGAGTNGGYAGNVWTTDVITINRIPEPATLVLLGLGAVALLRRR